MKSPYKTRSIYLKGINPVCIFVHNLSYNNTHIQDHSVNNSKFVGEIGVWHIKYKYK